MWGIAMKVMSTVVVIQSTSMVASTMYYVTRNSLCGSHDDYDSYIYVAETATLVCCACISPGDGV